MQDLDDFQDLSDINVSDVKITYKLRKRENPLLLERAFLVGDFLGEGVSAKVYEALDLNTLERRALKLYEFRRIFKLHNYEERVEMLKTEIRLLTKLNHKHLIKYVDVYSNQRKCCHHRDINIFAIMDYCTCCVDDLMESYPEKRLPMAKGHKYFYQLMQAVDYLHCKGIIHKDIKTANMLIDLADDIKLTDLGVCEEIDLFDVQPMCSKTNGSFIYQSPEMFDLNKRVFMGDAVDVWACGVTLYFMLTGKYPFEGRLLELMEKISHQDFIIPDHLAPDKSLHELLRRLMEKDAQKRITVTQILAHPWVQCNPANQLNLNSDNNCLVESGILPINAWFSHKQIEEVRPKPRTKYEDLYRSMSITPYLHQLHYPMQEEHNRVEVSEDELDEFENLRKIPLIRSNRSRHRKEVRKNVYKIYEKFTKIMGIKATDKEIKSTQ